MVLGLESRLPREPLESAWFAAGITIDEKAGNKSHNECATMMLMDTTIKQDENQKTVCNIDQTLLRKATAHLTRMLNGYELSAWNRVRYNDKCNDIYFAIDGFRHNLMHDGPKAIEIETFIEDAISITSWNTTEQYTVQTLLY